MLYNNHMIRVTDRTFSRAMLVTPMTIHRWRTGKTPAPDSMRLLATLLYNNGTIPLIPDWLKGNEQT